MKSLFTGRKRFLRGRSVILAGLVAVTVFAAAVAVIPGGTTLAAPPTPTPKAKVQGEQGRIERLERLFKRELNVLTTEQNRLTKANELVAKIQQYIDNQKSKGKDTSKLEEALSDFKAAISTAQSDYNTAKGILDARAGFNANGEVTNAAQARTTVRTAGKAERQFQQTVRKVTRQIRIAIRQYRQQNAPKPIANKQG